MKITSKTLTAMNDILFKCNNIRRWSSVFSTERYDELSKQAFNCAVSFMIAHELMCLNFKLDLTKFPKIAIVRLFEKSEFGDLQEDMLAQLAKYGIATDAISNSIYATIANSMESEDFKNFLFVDKNSDEAKLYKLATKIATYIELQEIRVMMPENVYITKRDEILRSIRISNVFNLDLNYLFDGSSCKYEFFLKYSSLRNRTRWAKQPSLVNCSVLGHQMDTAVLAYLESLETNPEDETLATKLFWMGIFHDLPEAWTGDMPSPLKDSIKGLREATEKFELEMMEKHVFSKLPTELVNALKSVMLEDGDNSSYKPTLKKADYMSANMECWRQLDAGSHSEYFKNVLYKAYLDKESLSSCSRQLLEHLCDILKD